MKLCVLGGGGVRTPFLAKSIASNASLANIKEVVFMDTNEYKLTKYGKLAKGISNRLNPDLEVTLTTSAEEALKDANYIITTLRVGGDDERVADEDTVREHGLLIQETTGACGFAFALRSIPVLLDYCNLAKKIAAEDYIIFNFTNPSGLVTQALYDSGHTVYGICDAPSEFIKQLANILEVPEKEFTLDCFGLNHLSFFNNFKVNGEDVSEKLLSHPDLFVKSEMRIFDKDILDVTDGYLLNEYLYFYFYNKKAIRLINSASETRAELIARVNRKMDKEMELIDVDKQFDEAFKIFFDNYYIRENAYMTAESGVKRVLDYVTPSVQEFLDEPDTGGYAGVALRSVRALETNEPVEMILSVPNNGVVDFLEENDVIEVSCIIDSSGHRVKNPQNLPEGIKNLILTMKEYERLASKSILTKNRNLAIKALLINPLVANHDIAKDIVDKFIERSGQEGWK